MQFTDEQQQFANAIRKFCDAECSTLSQRDLLTENGTLANGPALLKKFSELGWLGVSLPEEFGGGGAGMVDECIFLEETSRGLAPITAYSSSLTAAQTYMRYGTDEQKKTVVANMTAGKLESIALSEPGAGSDLGGVRIKSEHVGDHYVINGQKTWTSAAHVAENILVLTREDTSGSKHQGLTLLMVPANAPGLKIHEIRTMEAHTVNDLYFTDTFLPEDAVVGEVGNGWRQLMAGLNIERLILAAMMLGTAQRAFDDTLEFVTTRKQFGRPVGSFQALRHRIADLATEIECGRLLVYSVARMVDANPTKMFPREASMAKLKLTETAKKVALEGMQMMGGYGYATEFDMEHHVRKTLVSSIYGGTNEIQRDIIGKTYGL